MEPSRQTLLSLPPRWGAKGAALPSELVGANITVQPRNGQSWTTTVTAILECNSEQVIVTDSGRPSTPLACSCQVEQAPRRFVHLSKEKP